MIVQAPSNEITEFYRRTLSILDRSSLPFMLAGAYALQTYTGLRRDTKDLDIFCTPETYPDILQALASDGYRTEITDANWIAKAFCGDLFVDVIFASANGQIHIDKTWFDNAPEREIFGVRVRVITVTELIYSKLYIADRTRFDGADIEHLILRCADEIDWDRLLSLVGRDWQLLLARLLSFQWVYPSERDRVPQAVLDDLLDRQRDLSDLPVPKDRVSRGSLLSRTQYQVDIEEWGFKTT